MIIRITSNQALKIEQQSTDQDNALEAEFRVRLPDFRYVDTEAWDGWYRKYRNGKISKSFLNDVTAFCDKKNWPYEVIDERSSPSVLAPPPESVKDDIVPGITLFPHQLRSARACCVNEIGIISSPTGSGKTEMMAAIVRIFRCSTVIVADQQIVIDQIKARLELRKVVEEVGVFYAGKMPTGQLVMVGSIQSLSPPPSSLKEKKPQLYKSRMKKSKAIRALIKKCDLLLVDECDKCASKQFRMLFRKYYTGRRKYGFSGTPFDKDKPVDAFHIREGIGSIIAHTTRQEVEACGLTIPIKYLMVGVGKQRERDKSAYDIAVTEKIIENTAFHNKVADIVAAFPEDKTLIIAEFNDLGKNLVHAILDKGIEAVFIYGKTPRKARWEAIRRFEEGKLQCLIGGKIVKRGLDIKGGMDNLILCGMGKMWSDFDQKVGRALRRNPRGWSRVWDFYFLHNHYLYKHSRSRLRAIVDMGYKASVIFGNDEIEAEKLIRSNFRIPKKIKDKYNL
jgi:superfamily II DNA or RNA helicase